MTNWKSNYANHVYPPPSAKGSEVLAIHAFIVVTTALASADLLEFVDLPPGHVPVDCILDPDDLDSGTAITISVGLLNSGKTDLSTAAADGGAVWILNSAAAQTGVIARPTTKNLWRVTADASLNRMFGGKITAAAGTAVAGTIGATLLYRASHYGV